MTSPRMLNASAKPLVLLLCAWTLAAAASGPIPKLDTAWKKYANKELGYCVNYPAHWARGEAFDGTGMYFETGVKKFSKPLGEIDIGVVPEQQAGGMVEYLQMHLEGLRRFERAEQLEMVDTRTTTLVGITALFAKHKYFDPQDRADWIDEIVLAKHKGVLYRLELECRADEIGRFEPLFTRFVNTFKFECNARR